MRRGNRRVPSRDITRIGGFPWEQDALSCGKRVWTLDLAGRGEPFHLAGWEAEHLLSLPSDTARFRYLLQSLPLLVAHLVTGSQYQAKGGFPATRRVTRWTISGHATRKVRRTLATYLLFYANSLSERQSLYVEAFAHCYERNIIDCRFFDGHNWVLTVPRKGFPLPKNPKLATNIVVG